MTRGNHDNSHILVAYLLRLGFAPAKKQRLCTAHEVFGPTPAHSPINACNGSRRQANEFIKPGFGEAMRHPRATKSRELAGLRGMDVRDVMVATSNNALVVPRQIVADGSPR